ncbi:hypothetical protein MMC25_002734 [Agyrium rufum]|nr:hypothetical protein [Agyrium rufum]
MAEASLQSASAVEIPFSRSPTASCLSLSTSIYRLESAHEAALASPSTSTSSSSTSTSTSSSHNPTFMSETKSFRAKKKAAVGLRKPFTTELPTPPNTPPRSIATPTRDQATPQVAASKAKDAFPFPLQPSNFGSNKTISPISSPRLRGRSRDRARDRPSRFLSDAQPSSRSPDRYIPVRKSRDSLAKSFKLNKPPFYLSSSERLLRHEFASADPFTSPVGRNNLLPQRETHDASTTALTAQGSVAHSNNNNNNNGLGLRRASLADANRHVSAGAVWSVGGAAAAVEPAGPVVAVHNGRGVMLGSRTNAPIYSAQFFDPETPDQSHLRFEGRLAAALEIDQTSRLLDIPRSPERGRSIGLDSAWPRGKRHRSVGSPRTRWEDGKWVNDREESLLDAPQLRDDFYCSVLAYCHTSRTLAVGLNNRVYLWTEEAGVQYSRREEQRRNTYVTSLSFSSEQGASSILAIGRNDGTVSLWSLFDPGDRFTAQQPSAIACLAFKPVTTQRPSSRFEESIETEELLVGDEVGNVYYYSIEWPSHNLVEPNVWHGSMHLMAKISVHTQQICGLAWSVNGDYFATGGNDNICSLFEGREVLKKPASLLVKEAPLQTLVNSFGIPTFVPNAPSHRTISSRLSSYHSIPSIHLPSPASPSLSLGHLPRIQGPNPNFLPGRTSDTLIIEKGLERHRWIHGAAVKAIAFCPWQHSLVATGGGSNDRAIHFYHVMSGACLATIAVQAQVTSLIWSTTRREIAATFGYAQPDHAYRIAVFSWPECRQVVAIPWEGEMRALFAIGYPGGPKEATRQRGEGGRWWSRTADEGCIVVACSDESVKFHEVWSESRKGIGKGTGLLGGSDILESLEGIDHEGAEIIR